MHHETECGCGQHGHGGGPGMGHGYWDWGRAHHGSVCCCGCHHGSGIHHGFHFGLFGHRRFISKEEVIIHLEEYLKQLKAEVKGVEERIAEFKKTS